MKCEAIYSSKGSNFYRPKRCGNEAIVEVDGKHYCGIHNSERLEKKKREMEDDRKKRYYQKLRNR